jgi:hypothetical protein
MLPVMLLLYLQHNLFKELISARIVSFIILGSVVILDFTWISIYSGVANLLLIDNLVELE